MSINLSGPVSGASETVIRNIQRRLVQVLEHVEAKPKPGTLEKVAKIAEKQGQEGIGLVARFQELTRPPSPEPWHTVAHPGYVQDIIAGKSVLKSTEVFHELAAQTPATSGTHKLAVLLDGLEQQLPKHNLYSIAVREGLLKGSLDASDTEVARRFSNAILKADGIEISYKYQYFTPQQLKSALETLKALPGLTDTARMHIASAEREAAQLLPKLEVRTTKWWGKEEVTTDKEVEASLRRVYRLAISNVSTASTAVARDVAAEQSALLEKLLNYKINKAGEWKVYSAETWQKFQEASQGSINGRASGSSSSLMERSLFQKAIDTDVSTAFSGSTAGSSKGQILKSVEMPIPNMNVNAPMVSVQHVMKTEGDYIIYSNGQLHVLNRGNMADWFQLAKREIIHNARGK